MRRGNPIKIYFRNFFLINWLLIEVFLSSCKNNESVKVEIHEENERFELLVNNIPIFIKGLESKSFNPKGFLETGANTLLISSDLLKTYDQIDKNGWIIPDLNFIDTCFVDSLIHSPQFNKILAININIDTSLFQNELSVSKFNDQVNLLKQKMPDRPVILSIPMDKIDAFFDLKFQYDILGLKAWGDASVCKNFIKSLPGDIPIIVTGWKSSSLIIPEYTTWGSPIHLSHNYQASELWLVQEKYFFQMTSQLIGFIVSDWNPLTNKDFGWLGPNGESSTASDHLSTLWRGIYTKNEAPVIKSIRIDGRNNPNDNVFEPFETFTVFVNAVDTERDSLRFEYKLYFEGNTNMEIEFQILKDDKIGTLEFNTPADPGNYRLAVYVFDNHEHYCFSDVPFKINKL